MNVDERLERNKLAVRRFNLEVIAGGSESVFQELVDSAFVNRSAAPGMPVGLEGLAHTFFKVLRPALPDLSVEIHDQVAEGDRVVTRKTIRGTHRGPLFGIEPTQRAVVIEVIDIVRLKDGRYLEHWGLNTLPGVLAQLKGPI